MATPAEHLPGVLLARFARVPRLRAWEIAIWVAAFAAWFLLPRQAGLLNDIAILALFAVSLDLILGYGGIVSLGHAAFFGTGAYAAALFAKHVMPDPLVGLVVATAAAALLGVADVAGKYYVPKLGAFIIYCVMIVVLMLRPQGLFARPAGR